MCVRACVCVRPCNSLFFWSSCVLTAVLACCVNRHPASPPQRDLVLVCACVRLCSNLPLLETRESHVRAERNEEGEQSNWCPDKFVVAAETESSSFSAVVCKCAPLPHHRSLFRVLSASSAPFVCSEQSSLGYQTFTFTASCASRHAPPPPRSFFFSLLLLAAVGFFLFRVLIHGNVFLCQFT